MKSWVSSVLVLLAICMLPAHCVLADEKMNEVKAKELFSTMTVYCDLYSLTCFSMLSIRRFTIESSFSRDHALYDGL